MDIENKFPVFKNFLAKSGMSFKERKASVDQSSVSSANQKSINLGLKSDYDRASECSVHHKKKKKKSEELKKEAPPEEARKVPEEQDKNRITKLLNLV